MSVFGQAKRANNFAAHENFGEHHGRAEKSAMGGSASHMGSGVRHKAEKGGAAHNSGRATYTRRQLFLRSSIFDFVLVLILSTALVFTISYGFESAPSLRSNFLLEAAICAVLLLALFAGSWSKKAVVLAAGLYIVLAAIIVFVFAQLMPFGTSVFVDGQVNDVADNTVVFVAQNLGSSCAFCAFCDSVRNYSISLPRLDIIAAWHCCFAYCLYFLCCLLY